LGIHPITLLQKRKEGYFEDSHCYSRSGNGVTSKYLWNLEEVQKVFANWKAPRRG